MEPLTTAPSALDSMQWKQSLQSGKIGERQQIDEAAKQFEGILLRQFLDEALKSMDGSSGMFGSSVPMYDHLIKDALATSITQGTSLGLSTVLQAQLHKGQDESIQELNKK